MLTLYFKNRIHRKAIPNLRSMVTSCIARPLREKIAIIYGFEEMRFAKIYTA
jgi:hypothetical protein